MEPIRLDDLLFPRNSEGTEPLTFDIKIPKRTIDKTIRMICRCGERFDVPLALAGNAVLCPNCSAQVKLPEENFIRMTCLCGKPFKIPRVLAGKSGKCSQCGRQLKIQGESAHPVSADEQLQVSHNPHAVEALSDDQLDDVAGILMKEPLRKSSAQPGDKNLDDIEQVFVSDGPAKQQYHMLKKLENLYVRLDCLCGKRFAVPITIAHREIKCPQCHGIVKLPDKNFIHMQCSCGMEFKVPRILEGKYGVCPHCKKRLKISG